MIQIRGQRATWWFAWFGSFSTSPASQANANFLSVLNVILFREPMGSAFHSPANHHQHESNDKAANATESYNKSMIVICPAFESDENYDDANYSRDND